MKKSFFRLNALLLPALIALMGVASSCNSKSTETEEIAVTVSTVAVKSFNLKADTKVLAKLDSVFFSIDLSKGVIFNADSLPKGTNITKLVPVITFTTGMSKAEIVMSGGEEEDKTIDYLTNATDSIDFTRKVTLNVTAADGETTYSYRIKVNVHEQIPDSLMWDKMAVAKLPSRMESPVAQKTVSYKDKAYSLIKESDNTLTLSVSENLFDNTWTKTVVTPGFDPDFSSLAATSESLWILDTQGSLFSSADGITWTPTGETWATLIGSYLDCVIGVKSTDTGMVHCHYPAVSGITDPEVASDFPLTGRSEFVTLQNKYTDFPTAFFIGGVTPQGTCSSAVWAFDGSNWIKLSENALPKLNGAILVKYVSFKETSLTKPTIANSVWLSIGGRLDDGSFNRSTYISSDNGVNWRLASELMQLPVYFPHIHGAQAIVMDASLDADLSDAWTRVATRAGGTWPRPGFTLDGEMITWDCPYIHIFGGTLTDGSLSDAIWRGVLNRLAFTPII